MKKIVLFFVIACSTLFCYSQDPVQTLFEDANKDYKSIMESPNPESCQEFISKYKNMSGLDSIKSQILNSLLQDVNDINSNIHWGALESIHRVSAEIEKTKPFFKDPSYNTYEKANKYPKNIINVFGYTKKIKGEYENAIKSGNPTDLLKFRDVYNLYKSKILIERDSLENLKELYFHLPDDKEKYLEWIGFTPSIAIYEEAKPNLLKAAKPFLLETLKTSDTKLTLSFINDLVTPFMLFNPYSKENHEAYFDILYSINKNASNNSILDIFNLSEKYSTPLQKENFIASPEFKKLLVKRDSMRAMFLSEIYMIDLEPSNNAVGELIMDMYIISNYDLAKGGFTLKLGNYNLDKYSYEAFNTIIPNVIHRICFDVVPFKNILDPYDFNHNALFLSIDKNAGGKIEGAGQNLRVKLLFQLDKNLKSSNNKTVGDYLKASVCKIILYDAITSEILFSKLYKPNITPQTNVKPTAKK